MLAVLYLISLLWYGGRGRPEAPDEVEDLLRRMRRRAGRDDSTHAEPAMLRRLRDLVDGDDPVWDQVAAVRYRSRRDLLRMTVGIAGSRIDVHKWAALERTRPRT